MVYKRFFCKKKTLVFAKKVFAFYTLYLFRATGIGALTGKKEEWSVGGGGFGGHHGFWLGTGEREGGKTPPQDGFFCEI